MPEHSVIGHGISVNVGAQPTSFAWTRGRDGWDDRPTNPGYCRILTHGESHPTRWLQTYNEVCLIIDPRFAADVVENGLPTDRIAFVTRRAVADPVMVDYATTFRAELAAGLKIIEPGGMKTDFFTRSFDAGRHPAYHALVTQVMDAITDPRQMATYSAPEEIAEVVYEAATDGKEQLRYVAGADAKATYATRLQIGDEAFR